MEVREVNEAVFIHNLYCSQSGAVNEVREIIERQWALREHLKKLEIEIGNLQIKEGGAVEITVDERKFHHIEKSISQELTGIWESYEKLRELGAVKIVQDNNMKMVREVEEEKLSLVKEMSIQRLEVEKFCVAIKQLVDPLELGKKTRIIAEYDPKLPTVKINFYSEHETENGR